MFVVLEDDVGRREGVLHVFPLMQLLLVGKLLFGYGVDWQIDSSVSLQTVTNVGTKI